MLKIALKIQSKIIKQELVNWRNLKWLQSSKLKDLGAKGIDKLKNSLKENNFVQPFNVWQDGKGTIWILDGHHREKALKQLEAEGYEIPELLPANFVDCIDRKEAAKMVLLYSSIYAKITNEGLGEFLDDFELDISNLLNEIDLPGLDFESALEPETLPEDIDEAPQPLEKSYSILGDVFEIDGKHRVMCGDSTKESDVSILMNGNKADMVFTDPPYRYKPMGEGGCFDTAYKNLKNKIEGLTEFDPTNFLQVLLSLFNSGMNAYIFCNTDLVPDYCYWAREKGFNFNILTWHKKSFIPASNNHHYPDTEYLIYISKSAVFNSGLGLNYGKYFIEGNEKSKDHPTIKPISVISNEVEISSNSGSIVLDLFLGSGSTLIAAETTKRICYGMEIDQHYSDVILRRYKKTFPNATFKCLTRNDFPFEELFNA